MPRRAAIRLGQFDAVAINMVDGADVAAVGTNVAYLL